MPHLGTTTECQQPHCTDDAEETYHGPNDNTLRLCGSCYYRLVTRGRSLSDPLGLGTDEFRTCISSPVPPRMPDTEKYVDLSVDDSGGASIGYERVTEDKIKSPLQSWV